MGYFVQFEAEFSAPFEHKDYQIKVATKIKKLPERPTDRVCRTSATKEILQLMGIKVSKARGETYTPPAELLDLHLLPLAQCFAFRL